MTGGPRDHHPMTGGLPGPGDILRRSGLSARKSFGQHFLLDPSIVARIAALAAPGPEHRVIEIGPGPGGLTRALLETPAREVIAVERDSRFIAALAPMVEAAAGRLRLIEADAQATDLAALCPPPRIVAANLPYNVATPLLIGWLRRITDYHRLVLMFQKEVAQRITAGPGQKAYGRLAVMSQWVAEARYGFTVGAGSFTPPPNVDSAVVVLEPRPGDRRIAWEPMERVVAAAFGQRRKMLRAALKPLGDAERLLAEAGIDPQARAESVPVEGFERLAAAFGVR